MGETTTISWTDHTFNVWIGCHKISPGCDHCYAAELDNRWAGGHWGTKAPRQFMSKTYWEKPLAWNRKAARDGVRRRVFCASMADVFEDRDDLEPHRLALWDLILSTSHLDWLLLTKRPENFERLLPWGRLGAFAEPFRNVWLGVTAENQDYADKRIPILLATPSSIRFVSYEPALGPLYLRRYVGERREVTGNTTTWRHRGVDWVIAGDESGTRRRPVELEWIRYVRDQCKEAGVAFHLKQLHEGKKKIHLPVLDGHQHAEFPT